MLTGEYLESYLMGVNGTHHMTTSKASIIPESFPIKDYLTWRASITGYDVDQVVTAQIRGKKETYTILEWTYLLDDDIDHLTYRIETGEAWLHS